MEGSKEQLEREEANQERKGCKPKEMSSRREWSESDEDPNVIFRPQQRVGGSLMILFRAAAGPREVGSQMWRVEEGVQDKGLRQWVLQDFSCKRDNK